MDTMMDEVGTAGLARYDAVVVGGGAAGLSGALALARARRSVLVIDAGEPRNAPADKVHNYLGREGTPPLELLAIGRSEVEGYGGEIVTGRVTAVTRIGNGEFRVEQSDGTAVIGRRLLVTTGLTDELPDLPGLAQHWGRDVLHCPYCHGWEVQDEAIVVLATTPAYVHQAMMWTQWSSTVNVVLHGTSAATGEEATMLAALGVATIDGPAAAVEESDGRITGVRLESGGVVPCTRIVVPPFVSPKAELLETFGLTPAELKFGEIVIGSFVPADPMTGATDVPGVWVAGNVASPMDQVIAAAAAGLKAGAMINMDLILADARSAVAATSVSAE